MQSTAGEHRESARYQGTQDVRADDMPPTDSQRGDDLMHTDSVQLAEHSVQLR